jgi:hypothetical protein
VKICSARTTVGGCSRSQRLSGVAPHSSSSMHRVHCPRPPLPLPLPTGDGGPMDDAADHSLAEKESSVKLCARPSSDCRDAFHGRRGAVPVSPSSPLRDAQTPAALSRSQAATRGRHFVWRSVDLVDGARGGAYVFSRRSSQ